MKQVAVSVNNVSKKFRLFNSPKERLFEALHPFNKKYHKEFWALKDINFEVLNGQTLGIIGRNGSGKSTLLQIICSILRPTTGNVKVSGRVSSILELGAGFNPEFTGRSNVLLNGSLMGLSEREIKDRMPQIEAFADIGEFIDQPLKIYSSGMFVRLAFAAAVNVDPDILVIDEALAVGDAKFQHKCYQKFIEFQKSGKTIMFVTHDLNAITRYCHQAILLENGKIIKSGHPNDVVNNYFKMMFTDGYLDNEVSKPEISSPKIPVPKGDFKSDTHVAVELDRFLKELPDRDSCFVRKSYNKNEFRFGDKRAEIVDYLVVSGNEYDPADIDPGISVDIYFKVLAHDNIDSPLFGYGVKTKDGVYIYATNTELMKVDVLSLKKADMAIFKFSTTLNLKGGDYFISLGIAENRGKISGDKKSMMDSRTDFIHLSVKEKRCFDGLVELKTSFNKISNAGALSMN